MQLAVGQMLTHRAQRLGEGAYMRHQRGILEIAEHVLPVVGRIDAAERREEQRPQVVLVTIVRGRVDDMIESQVGEELTSGAFI